MRTLKLSSRARTISLILLLAVIIAILLSSGCKSQLLSNNNPQHRINTAQLSSSLAQLDKQLSSTEPLLQGLKDSISDTDYLLLQSTAADVLQLRSTLHGLINSAGGLNQFLINTEQVELLYLKAGESYARARAIIQKNWQILPLDSQMTLKSLDAEIMALEKNINQLNLTNKTDMTAIMLDVVGVAAVTLKALSLAGVLL